MSSTNSLSSARRRQPSSRWTAPRRRSEDLLRGVGEAALRVPACGETNDGAPIQTTGEQRVVQELTGKAQRCFPARALGSPAQLIGGRVAALLEPSDERDDPLSVALDLVGRVTPQASERGEDEFDTQPFACPGEVG